MIAGDLIGEAKMTSMEPCRPDYERMLQRTRGNLQMMREALDMTRKLPAPEKHELKIHLLAYIGDLTCRIWMLEDSEAEILQSIDRDAKD